MQKRNFDILVFILILFAGLFSCKKDDIEGKVPSCIRSKINKIQKAEVQNPPAHVSKWEVDGETYYYFTSDCCDQFNYLYDENCDAVCAPDGGLTGTGDGNCPQWQGTLESHIIWEDDRE